MERRAEMNPERWQRTEDLYHAARARAPGARAAFLAEACGDDESLRSDVASLLNEQSSDDEFLNRAVHARLLSDASRSPPNSLWT